MDYIIIENENIGQIKAKLLTDKNPETCKTIWENLPFKLNLSRWGEELYGEIPVSIDMENYMAKSPSQSIWKILKLIVK
ncbi:MAG: cyclophilin-like family protein [Promethearchaeota archaeon]